ncbi:ABC transporter substrate-binding protein [Falsiroseomonas sp. CW058]|uniref:ABC transporter substrate-binding protein n=1 Tax=Falsiroseomonas sp. CW058 TaxID=3388664 RepID=UPI003D31CB5D
MKARRSIVALGLVALGFAAAPQAQANQLAEIMQRRELRCATFADVPPFAAPDPRTREMVGHDVDLCRAIARRWGVQARITPVSVEARVPEVRLGRVDLTIANLAYTLSRAEQIQFSDPYYLAKEMLAVRANDPGRSRADYAGRRLASTRGSTSELAIRMNGSEPLTFADTGSAFMAVQQNRAFGIVANTMTITKLVNDSQTAGVPMRMIEEPMAFQPIGVGMKRDEPQLLARVNETLAEMERDGELTAIWNRWLGPDTEFRMVRTDRVTPFSQLQFTPLP